MDEQTEIEELREERNEAWHQAHREGIRADNYREALRSIAERRWPKMYRDAYEYAKVVLENAPSDD